MKGIYVSIFGVFLLAYAFIDFEFNMAVLMPFITIMLIAIALIIVGIIKRGNIISLEEIFKDLY